MKQSTDYELSDEQLRAILAMQSSAGASPREKKAKEEKPVSMWGELHVTLWDTVNKRRIPGSAYAGDMMTYLKQNPHLEVYNRQDDVSRKGQQLLAGQKMEKIETTEGGKKEDVRVVMWHTKEQRKLSSEESPTESQLCKFLKEHPQIQIFAGQVADRVVTETMAPLLLEFHKPSAAPAQAELLKPPPPVATGGAPPVIVASLSPGQPGAPLGSPLVAAAAAPPSPGKLAALAQLAKAARPTRELKWKPMTAWK